jgi:hypothetical protein
MLTGPLTQTTAEEVGMKLRMGRTVAAVILLAGIQVTAPVMAGTNGAGPHGGDYGYHWLLDSQEYPAVTCVYDSQGHIDRVKIRRPIVFGDDRRPSQVDSQWVGWRAIVQYSDSDMPTSEDWSTQTQTSIVKDYTSDKHPAEFLPRTVNLSSGAYQHTNWRVRYRLLWYYPSKSDQDGYAVHDPNWIYQDEYGSSSDQAYSRSYCPGDVPV